jgi:hypothetical protein
MKPFETVSPLPISFKKPVTTALVTGFYSDEIRRAAKAALIR